ncbi:MAG: tRNA (N(6)-L-threonylcarbamoyladenosine(37)-C(2))-methylthiotransferase [Candidatus Pacearchaeota archaeon]|jgi:MiaB-like tRNA modifying enzyme
MKYSKKKKLFVKTYGCQANINDSEILAAKYAKIYKIVDSENEADVILLNSCSVKNKTQSKIIHYIGKNYPSKEIIIVGCLVKTIDVKKQFPNVKIVDSSNLKRLGQELVRKDKKIGIIQISQGCLNECAYCATKLARGELKSYSIEEIKFELEEAVNGGCTRIYLTSQDNGCWGFDLKPRSDLATLLSALVYVKGNYKIRVGMMNPQYVVKFLPELLKVFESNRIQKFIHIPVQSGSNKVLRAMKRGHSVEDFVKIVEKFRKNFPRSKFRESTIATDIIIGYPTETDEDFEKTLDLIRKIKPEVLNISVFSSRPGTAASKLKQLSSEFIKKRSKKLNDTYLSYRPEIDKRKFYTSCPER